jgi:hypothetical protein
VIRKGRIDPEWQAVNENLFSITQCSLSTLIKNQGIGDLLSIRSQSRMALISISPAYLPTSASPATSL